MFRFFYIYINTGRDALSLYSTAYLFSLIIIFLVSGCVHEIILPGNENDPDSVDLIVIHFNDGESKLINAGAGKEDFGGIARFATVIEDIRKNADADVTGNSCVTLSAGDNFLVGRVFNLSLKKGLPYYDAMALDIMGIDAITLGNHDFDLGPDVLADFIASFSLTRPVFLSANLIFSEDPRLDSLKKAGSIATSTIIERGRKRFGVIGLTTPELRIISSPGDVIVKHDLKAILQREADLLEQYGVDKIILVSHLQDIRNEMKLIRQTRNIDIVVSGGGNELLANKGDLLISDNIKFDEKKYGPYPFFVENVDKKLVPVVTTPGEYRYVGCLRVKFDSRGELSMIYDGSGLIRVAGDGYQDAVLPNKQIRQEIVIPIAKALSTSSRVIATSKVFLDGERAHVRSRETNLGDLIADAVLWMARQNAAKYKTNNPTIAMINGGSIRTSIKSGKISEADIYNASPFNNFITIVETLSAKELKNVFENSLAALRVDTSSNMISDSGRFPQLSNVSIIYNPTRPAGKRIKEIKLHSGDIIVKNYRIVQYAPSVDVATLDFLARGGDHWDFGRNKKINIGVSVPNAISSYITFSNKQGGLNKTILNKQYPKTGTKRILVTRE